MITLSELFIVLGRTRLSKSLSVGASALSNAEREGFAPASWYAVVQELATEKGIEVPDSLFKFKKPAPLRTDEAPQGHLQKGAV